MRACAAAFGSPLTRRGTVTAVTCSSSGRLVLGRCPPPHTAKGNAMHRHRTGTSRRQKGLFAACVVAVVAVVAACSPPPDLESRLEERRGEIEREVRVELERIQREATRAWHRWLERRQMRGGTDAPPRPGGEQPAPPPSTTTTTVPPAPEPAPAPPPASAGSRQPLGPG